MNLNQLRFFVHRGTGSVNPFSRVAASQQPALTRGIRQLEEGAWLYPWFQRLASGCVVTRFAHPAFFVMLNRCFRAQVENAQAELQQLSERTGTTMVIGSAVPNLDHGGPVSEIVGSVLRTYPEYFRSRFEPAYTTNNCGFAAQW